MSTLALLLAAGIVVVPTLAWTYEASCIATFGVYGINASCWSGTKWVLCGMGQDGNSSYGRIVHSADGATFTLAYTNTTKDYYSCGSDGAGNVLCGANGGLLTYSTDGGVSWTANSTMASTWANYTVYGIAYRNSRYMLVGDSGRVAYATSVSGNCIAQTVSGASNAFRGVCYGYGSTWVAVGDSGQCAVTTDNGANWATNTGLSAIFGSYSVRSIAYGNGLFVAVGGNGLVATSPNGVTWTARTGVTGTNTGRCVLFNGSYFVLLADGGYVATSIDGITWVSQTGLSGTSWGTQNGYCIAYKSGALFAAGAGGRGALCTNA